MLPSLIRGWFEAAKWALMAQVGLGMGTAVTYWYKGGVYGCIEIHRAVTGLPPDPPGGTTKKSKPGAFCCPVLLQLHHPLREFEMLLKPHPAM